MFLSRILTVLWGFGRICQLIKVLICDAYQKRILDTVINNVYYESSLYRRYDSPLVIDKGRYPKYYMEHGFVSLVRGTENFISKIKEFPKDDVRIIYSMWTGYIEENLALKELLDTYPSIYVMPVVMSQRTI